MVIAANLSILVFGENGNDKFFLNFKIFLKKELTINYFSATLCTEDVSTRMKRVLIRNREATQPDGSRDDLVVLIQREQEDDGNAARW